MRQLIFMSIFLLSLSSATAPPAEDTCVSLGRFEIICLKENAGSFTPVERSRAIKERLERLSTDDAFDIKNIQVLKHKTTTDVVANELIIISISNQDATHFGISRDQLALEVQLKIQAGIEEERKKNRPDTLLTAILLTFITSISFIILLFLLSFIYRTTIDRIKNNKGIFIRSFFIHTYEILSPHQMVVFLCWFMRTLKLFGVLLLIYIYVSFTFSFFPTTASLTPTLFNYALKPFREIYSLVIDFIPNLFFILAIIFITKYALDIIKFIFKEIEHGKLIIDGFYREWAQPTYKLIRFLVFAIAFVMAFPYIPGSSSPAFQGVSVFLGLLLSIGSSSAISNIVSGIVITYMRPFKVGDSVKIADTIGDVMERNLFVTRIKTMKQVEVTIPNSMALASHIVNFSLGATTTGLILHTTISIAYDVPWPRVHELLKKAALMTKYIENNPSPFILQLALKDSFVAYELNAYTRHPAQMPFIYSELHEHMQDCFKEAGINITLPHYVQLERGAYVGSLGE